MPRPIHFEIHAADPQRAIRFYTQLFGWTFTKWESPMDYWLIKTGERVRPASTAGLLPRRGDAAGAHAALQRLRVHHRRHRCGCHGQARG